MIEYLLIFILIATLVGSFFCSLSEACLYSLPASYVKLLAESGSRSGRILAKLKEDMSQPIAAILMVNTLANSLGPALAGALAEHVWGQAGVLWTAGGLTFAILIAGEITPKVLGVTYARSLAPWVAIPVYGAVKLFAPLIWLSRGITTAVQPEEPSPSVSHEEVKSMAEIGTEEGSLDEFEGAVIQNVIELDEVIVRDVLTPRVVVFRLRDDLTVGEVEKELADWAHSRVPIYPEADPDHLTGYVLQRDVFREAVRGNKSAVLKQIARPLPVVPELMRVDRLLLRMVDKREHIAAVVDEHGSLAGIVTLEDAVEELLGREIVDEYDAVADLRTFAGLLRVVRDRRRPQGGDEALVSGKLSPAKDPRSASLEKVLREARRLKASHHTTVDSSFPPSSSPGSTISGKDSTKRGGS